MHSRCRDNTGAVRIKIVVRPLLPLVQRPSLFCLLSINLGVIDDYAQKYLFAPLGMRHEWKRTYLGVVDTEGGLYLNGSDLAKIGYLYLNDGVWEGQRVISSEWVKQSLSHSIQDDEPDVVGGRSSA